MLSSNKNIDSLQKLLQELLLQVKLQKRYVQLDIVKKMTILLSAFTIGAILFLLGAIVILYLSYLCTLLLTEWFGSMVTACALICVVVAVVALVVYAFRKRLITDPLTAFLARLFIDPKNKD